MKNKNLIAISGYEGSGKDLVGIKDIESNTMFAEFGSACGTFLEAKYNNDPQPHEDYKHLLSDLDRKGNGSEAHPLRLTGESKWIPTKYDRKLTLKFLQGMDEVAKEISDYNEKYLSL